MPTIDPPRGVVWEGALWLTAAIGSSMAAGFGWLFRGYRKDRRELKRNSAVLLRHARKLRTHEKRLSDVRGIHRQLRRLSRRVGQNEMFTQTLSGHMGDFQQSQISQGKMLEEMNNDLKWVRDILSDGGKLPHRHE